MIRHISRNQWMRCLILALACGAGLPAGLAQVAGVPHKCAPKFTGRPRDIDFHATWKSVQIILTKDAATELISRTPNPRILSILEAAFGLKANVQVDYKTDPTTNDNILTCVILDLEGPPGPRPGEILSLAFDEADVTCYASIQQMSAPVDVKTQDATAQGILETAALMKLPVQDLTYDPMTKLITRVRVNMP